MQHKKLCTYYKYAVYYIMASLTTMGMLCTCTRALCKVTMISYTRDDVGEVLQLTVNHDERNNLDQSTVGLVKI